MAVNLSPVGGVAAQFFDNNGNPLSGGKLYTYAAGTTVPAATYTSASGSTAHSNPIILDAAGRVPGGEIWLTDGAQFKFVLKTSTDTLIATYDNIVGINSNFVNYTNQQEIQTADPAGTQTVFTLTTMSYQPGTNSLSVFVDGVNQYGPGAQYAYTETSSTSVTFDSPLHPNASVKFTTSAINASSYGDAFQISYTPPFTGSEATNVGDKLAQTVSVKDFGAVGNGVADDTDAFVKFFAELNANGGSSIVPYATYKVGTNLTITKDNVEIDFQGSTLDLFDNGTLQTADNYSFITVSANNAKIINLNLKSTAGISMHMIRGGDYTYNGSGTGTQYSGIVFENIYADTVGVSGVGCGVVSFAGAANSYMKNIRAISCLGQVVSIYGGVNCELDGGYVTNGGDCAFYIGSNQGTAAPSLACRMQNLFALINAPVPVVGGTGIFLKVSRAATSCTVEKARFYGAGNGTTVRAIDPLNGQPGVWMQSGYKTTYRDVTVNYYNLDQQVAPAFGLFAHNTIGSLDNSLSYPTLDSCAYESTGTTASIDAVLVYPTAGVNVTKPVIINCTFDGAGSNAIQNGIHCYANDSSNGKIVDLTVKACEFKNCTYGILSELGGSGAAGDITNIYLDGDNSVSGTTPATYWSIGANGGTLITSRNDFAPSYTAVNAATTLAINLNARSSVVRIYKNTSGSTINVTDMSGVSTLEGTSITLTASYDVGSGDSIVLVNGGAGNFRLAGGTNFTLASYSSVTLVRVSTDWVEVSRRS